MSHIALKLVKNQVWISEISKFAPRFARDEGISLIFDFSKKNSGGFTKLRITRNLTSPTLGYVCWRNFALLFEEMKSFFFFALLQKNVKIQYIYNII